MTSSHPLSTLHRLAKYIQNASRGPKQRYQCRHHSHRNGCVLHVIGMSHVPPCPKSKRASEYQDMIHEDMKCRNDILCLQAPSDFPVPSVDFQRGLSLRNALYSIGTAGGIDAVMEGREPAATTARGKSHVEFVGGNWWIFGVRGPWLVLVHWIRWNALGPEQ